MNSSNSGNSSSSRLALVEEKERWRLALVVAMERNVALLKEQREGMEQEAERLKECNAALHMALLKGQRENMERETE